MMVQDANGEYYDNSPPNPDAGSQTFFNDPKNAPPPAAPSGGASFNQAEDARSRLDAMSAAHGVPLGSTDLANAIGKNAPGSTEGAFDYENYLAAIDRQLGERASNIPGGGGGSDGRGGTSTLGSMGYGANGAIMPFTDKFGVPTAESVRNTPGYQFKLEEGMKTFDRHSSAGGVLNTGGTKKALSENVANFADTYYQQAFDNAWQQYWGSFLIDRANKGDQFNSTRSLSNDQWAQGRDVFDMNRLSNNDAFDHNFSIGNWGA